MFTEWINTKMLSSRLKVYNSPKKQRFGIPIWYP